MQLTKVTLVIFFWVWCSHIAAQKPNTVKTVSLKNGLDIYQHIYDSAFKYTDSLTAVAGRGTLFIRFKINGDGIIEDIKASKKHPSFLIKLISKVLDNKKVVFYDSASHKSMYYVLPVIYDYYTGNETAADIMKKIPKLDLAEIGIEESATSFNALFNINNTKDGVVGVNCIFLPSIELRGKVK